MYPEKDFLDIEEQKHKFLGLFFQNKPFMFETGFFTVKINCKGLAHINEKKGFFEAINEYELEGWAVEIKTKRSGFLWLNKHKEVSFSNRGF